MPLTIEVEQEGDGRWLAEVPELPGVLCYGQGRQEAVERAQALALRVLADRLEQGKPVPQLGGLFAIMQRSAGAVPTNPYPLRGTPAHYERPTEARRRRRLGRAPVNVLDTHVWV